MTHVQDTAYDSVRRLVVVLIAAALALATAPFLATDAEAAHLEGTGEGPGTIEYDPDEDDPDGFIPSYRFFGANRFDTAELIATDDTIAAPAFESDTVIVARADIFPDALAGSGLGGATRAPIVLTPNNTAADNGELNEDLRQTLESRGEALEKVYILGSTAAIAQDVEDAINDFVGDNAEVERVGGVNRFETAKLVADELRELGFEYDNAIVARADEFADALVSGALSAAEQFPILLTGRSGPLDPFAAQALEGVETAFIAGGTEAIAAETADEIDEQAGEVRRVFGADRFATAVAFAQLEVDEFGFDTDHFNLARADDFPDALALGPHAGLDLAASATADGDGEEGDGGNPAPILLTATDDFSQQTEDYFNSFEACTLVLHVAGGVNAITQEVEDEARAALTNTEGICRITLTPETATNPVGEPHTVTATLLAANGEPASFEEAVTVTFEAEGRRDPGRPQSSTAIPMPMRETVEVEPGSTTAQFTFTSRTPGTVIVTASVENADGEIITATATKEFVRDMGIVTAPAAGGRGGGRAGGDGKVAAASVPKPGG